jgi:hypothetical protein
MSWIWNSLQADGSIHYDITSCFNLPSLANILHARTRPGDPGFCLRLLERLSMITGIVVRLQHPAWPLLQHYSFSAECSVSVSCVLLYAPRDHHW